MSITHASEEQTVTLTLTLTLGDATITRTYTVKVEDQDNNVYEISFHFSGSEVAFYFDYATDDVDYQIIIEKFKRELQSYIQELSEDILD